LLVLLDAEGLLEDYGTKVLFGSIMIIVLHMKQCELGDEEIHGIMHGHRGRSAVARAAWTTVKT
jgi:hypothetical protein